MRYRWEETYLSPCCTRLYRIHPRPEGRGFLRDEMVTEKKTPTLIEVEPGTYEVTYHKPGFKDVTVEVNVKKGKIVEVPAKFTILINEWIKQKGGKEAITVADINEILDFFLEKSVNVTLKDVNTVIDAFLT